MSTFATFKRFSVFFISCFFYFVTSHFTYADSRYVSNVEGVKPSYFSTQFWLEKTANKDKVLLTPQQISALNKAQFERQDYLVQPLSYPATISHNQLKNLVLAISKPSKSERFYANGTKLTAEHYRIYQENLNLQQLTTAQPVRFALVTQRSSLRTFPTLDRIFNKQMNLDIDRFQESAVFPGEALAVLHTSADGQWVFVQNYHYRAWLQVKDIAFASRKDVKAFVNPKNKLVVTGSKVFTSMVPSNADISEVQLEMGVVLPRVLPQDLKQNQVHGQNPFVHHVVLLPTRNQQGNLVLKQTLITRNADVATQFLPMTAKHIIEQSFKFLGERYGWGHDFNGRDCTGFVGEVYKSFGLLLPRNTGQQSKDPIGDNKRFGSEATPAEKSKAIDNMRVGDLIYIPGHVAIYLGEVAGKPFIIHDVHGLNYHNSKGELVSGMLNGVSVSPLFDTYRAKLTNIKRVAHD